MSGVNVWALTSLIIKMASLGMILFYIIPKQFKEVMRPKNWITPLRWRLLLLFGFSITSALPALVYQVIRTFGSDSPGLRNVASISGNLSTLATTILLYMVYNYKKKDL